MSPRRISKKSQQPDTIDVDTFKAWLQGVEDMQSPDWAPNVEQWRKIRQKIDQLEVPEDQPQGQQVLPMPSYPIYRTPVPGPGGSIGVIPHSGTVMNPAPPPSSLDAKPSDANVGTDGSFKSSFT